MTYKIAIASGKGGTGKTTVAVNLLKSLSKMHTYSVQLIDCDVEEPNDFLFFGNDIPSKKSTVYQQIPFIDKNKCTYCRKCADYCVFNAISIIPTVKHAEVNGSLCHSCGACLVACEFDAIREINQDIGSITQYKTPYGEALIEGRLKIGSPMQTMMVKETKKAALPDVDITLIDSPPGTSCPVVESVSDANYVVLVTEPTPFGLHDFKLMVTLLRDMNKTFGVIINKDEVNQSRLYQFIEDEKIEVLGKLPFLRSYAEKYAEGKILENTPPEIEEIYSKITKKIAQRL